MMRYEMVAIITTTMRIEAVLTTLQTTIGISSMSVTKVSNNALAVRWINGPV